MNDDFRELDSASESAATADGLFADVRTRTAEDLAALELEAVIDRFEDAWQRGQRPTVEAYWSDDLPHAANLLQELVLVDLEHRWAAGLAASTGDYLQRFPALNRMPETVRELRSAEAELLQLGADQVQRAQAAGIADTRGRSEQSTLGRRFAEDAPSAHEQPAGAPQIPGYEVLREIGRGGMGVVYEARDLTLHRRVAIKIVDAAARGGEEMSQRLLREAQAVARLQHPNIVQVYEVGRCGRQPFLVLELLTGGSLQDRLRQATMPARQAAELIHTLSRAVQGVHDLRLVHRDLKPANILFAADGTPKISDFGLAKHADDDAGLTRTGEIVGTPSHMAPEQALGQSREVTSAADVYSLGSILFECLAGRPPFQASSVHETLEQLRREPAPSLRRLVHGIPRDLATICAKCLEKLPDRRYASAQLLAEDLRRFLDGKPILARPVGPLGKLARWARRQPVVATLTALSATLLLTIAVVSTLANRENQRLAKLSQAANEKLLAQVYTVHCRRALEAKSDAADPAVRLLLDLQTQGLPTRFADRFERRFLASRFQSDRFPTLVLPPKVDVVRFLPNQLQVVAADQLGRLHFIDALTRLVLRTMQAHDKCLNDIVFSPDGRWACTASCDRTAKLWDLANWQPVAAPLVHPWKVSACAFSPDGRWLATATDDEAHETRGKHPIEVRLWDTADWTCRHMLEAQPHGIVRMFFRDSGQQLIAVNAHHQVERLDLSGEEPKWLELLPSLHPINRDHHVHRAALSPSGRWLAEQTNALQGVDIRDLETGDERLLISGLGISPHAVRFLDDRRLLFVSPAGRLGIWNVADDYLEADFGLSLPNLDLDVSADGAYFAAGGEGGHFHVGKVPSADEAFVLTVALPDVRFPAITECVSPDLSLATGVDANEQGRRTRMFDLPSGAPRPVPEFALQSGNGAVVSPNRRFAVFRRMLPSRRYEQALVSLDEPMPRLIARILLDSTWPACFSPDSSRVFGVANGRGQLFDSASGRVLQEFPLPATNYGACFIHGGSEIVVSEGGRSLRLDLASGQQHPCGNGVYDVEVMGERILKPGTGLCDLVTGDLLTTFEQPPVGNNVDGAISPDAQTVAMINSSPLVGLWDAETGAYLGPLVDDPVGNIWRGCRFSTDGRQLVAWGQREQGGSVLGLVMFFRILPTGPADADTSPASGRR